MTTENNYNRRFDDRDNKSFEDHKRVTEKHGQYIASLRTDVAGLKTGLDSVGQGVERIGSKLDMLAAPKPTNWTGVGSLIVAVVLVFGGVVSFLFKAQNLSTHDALIYSSKESQLRHEIQESQIERIDSFASHIYNRLIKENERQQEMNLKFIQEYTKKYE